MHSFKLIIVTLVVLFSFIFATQASTLRHRYGALPVLNNPLLPRHLVARTDVCLDEGSTKCNITGASFCCPSSTECISLENNTSVICCKVGDICDVIQPIDCPVTTTTESKTAPKCGDQCCPIGFECDPSGKKCLMKEENLPDKYKNKPSATGTPTVTPTSTATPGNATEGEAGNAKSGADSTTPILGATAETEQQCADFPAKAIVVGFFPGLLLGVSLVFLWIKLMEERNRRRSIKSFGVFSTFPSNDNLPEKPIVKKPSFPHGFVSAPAQPRQDSSYLGGSAYSPLSSAFRSPNLGPVIPPLSTSRSSREPTVPEHLTQLAPRPAERRDTVLSFACSEVAVVDYMPPPTPPPPLNIRRKSIDTGYSASVYTDGNESKPFVVDPRNEVAIPPIPKPLPLFARQGGGPLPRPALTGWSNRV